MEQNHFKAAKWNGLIGSVKYFVNPCQAYASIRALKNEILYEQKHVEFVLVVNWHLFFQIKDSIKHSLSIWHSRNSLHPDKRVQDIFWDIFFCFN